MKKINIPKRKTPPYENLARVQAVNDDKTREETYAWWEDATKLAKLETAFKTGMNVQEACLIAEITLTQYYYYAKVIDPDYKEKVKVWQLTPVATAKRNLFEGLQAMKSPLKDKQGNVITGADGKPVFVESDFNRKERIENSKWLLERKAKKEYSTRKEVTGADGKEVLTPQTYGTLLKTLDVVLGSAIDEDIQEGSGQAS